MCFGNEVEDGSINGKVCFFKNGNSLLYLKNGNIFCVYDPLVKTKDTFDISNFAIEGELDISFNEEGTEIIDFCCMNGTVYSLLAESDKYLLVEHDFADSINRVLGKISYLEPKAEAFVTDNYLIIERPVAAVLLKYDLTTGEETIFEENATDFSISPSGEKYAFVRRSDTGEPNEIIIRNALTHESIGSIRLKLNGATESFSGMHFDASGSMLNYSVMEMEDSVWSLFADDLGQKCRTVCFSINLDNMKVKKVITTEWGNVFVEFFGL